MSYSLASKLAAGALVGGIAYSEIAHAVERKITPISDSTSILPHEVFPGPAPDSPALFFLHGWPDDVVMFRKYAQALSKTYHCVNCTLPGYPTPESFTGHAGTMPTRNWGYGFDEAVKAVKATIDLTCQGHITSQVGVTLVLHDWGCIVGNLVVDEYAELNVHRMINMDVGSLTGPGLHLGVYLMCLAYQAPLNVFWMLPNGVGDALTVLESMILMRTEPPGTTDKPSPVTSAMNWPYRTAWRELLTGGQYIRRALNFSPRAQVPMLFLCAQDRPTFMRFCDEDFMRKVRDTTPLSRTDLVGGNHWFPNQHAKTTMDTVTEWLQQTHAYDKTAKL